jgi:hypothetical protein
VLLLGNWSGLKVINFKGEREREQLLLLVVGWVELAADKEEESYLPGCCWCGNHE